MKKQLKFAASLLAVVALAFAVHAGGSWGKKVAISVDATLYTLEQNASHLTVYNAGTNDLFVGLNCSTNVLIAQQGSNIAAVVGPSQACTFDATPGVGSVQLNYITTVAMKVTNETCTVYMAAY